VLFFEHKYLYRRLKAELPVEDYTIPIGEARWCRRAQT
jgi:2-oxoisovalerate dehydrogenase E1 component beta subunit